MYSRAETSQDVHIKHPNEGNVILVTFHFTVTPCCWCLANRIYLFIF